MKEKHEFVKSPDPKKVTCVKCGAGPHARVHHEVPKRAPYTPPTRVEKVYDCE